MFHFVSSFGFASSVLFLLQFHLLSLYSSVYVPVMFHLICSVSVLSMFCFCSVYFPIVFYDMSPNLVSYLGAQVDQAVFGSLKRDSRGTLYGPIGESKHMVPRGST